MPHRIGLEVCAAASWWRTGDITTDRRRTGAEKRCPSGSYGRPGRIRRGLLLESAIDVGAVVGFLLVAIMYVI